MTLTEELELAIRALRDAGHASHVDAANLLTARLNHVRKWGQVRFGYGSYSARAVFLALTGPLPGAALPRAPTGAEPGTGKGRCRNFNDTTGAITWNRRSAMSHPNRCVCQDETTPHKHYPDPPHGCARCGECEAYRPATPAPALTPPSEPRGDE